MAGDVNRGRLKLEWARDHMPVLEGIRRRFETERPLSGLTVSAVLHVEAKTCILALALKAAGADVRLAASNPLSTDDDAVAAVREEGVPTWAENFPKPMLSNDTSHNAAEGLARTLAGARPPANANVEHRVRNTLRLLLFFSNIARAIIRFNKPSETELAEDNR